MGSKVLRQHISRNKFVIQLYNSDWILKVFSLKEYFYACITRYLRLFNSTEKHFQL